MILAGLGSVSRILESAQQRIDENAHSYFASETLRDHDQMIRGFMSKASNRFADDYLVLSANFTSLYESMQSDLVQVQYADFPDDHEPFAEAI